MGGLTEIFVRVKHKQDNWVKMNSLHLDSSSFHVDGEYTSNIKSGELEPE